MHFNLGLVFNLSGLDLASWFNYIYPHYKTAAITSELSSWIVYTKYQDIYRV